MDLTIREARPSDAGRLIAYIRRLIAEPGIDVELSPGEFDLTVEEEKENLADYAVSENSIYLLAEVENEIVGVLICTGGKRSATRHVATLGGMSVKREWRHQGIGTQLMTRATEWAERTDIVTRLELSVFARNEAAIRLYRTFGFVVEGCRRKAIYRDGEYLDDLRMGKLLPEEKDDDGAVT